MLSRRLAIIGVSYYLTEDRIERFLRKFVLDKVKFESITVNLVNLNDVRDLNPGLPNLLDMTGYYLGRNDIDSADLFFYFNDTLITKHPFKYIFRVLACLFELVADSEVPSAAGIVDKSTPILQKPDAASLSHMSTFAIVLNQYADNIFRTLLEDAHKNDSSLDEWVSRKCIDCPSIVNILYTHLYASKNPWSWDPDGLKKSIVTNKAATVVVEELLTRSIIESNGFVFPVNHSWKYKLFKLLSRMRCALYV